MEKTPEWEKTAVEAARRIYDAGRRSASQHGVDEFEACINTMKGAMDRAVKLHESDAIVHPVRIEVVSAKRG